MRILFSKYANWSFHWYQKSDHPELVAIRNIIAKNPAQNYILIGDGTKIEHFSGDGISFYNMKIDTAPSYLFTFFLKMAMTSIFRPSVIVCLGTINSVPLGLSSILTRSKFIPVIAGEISYGVESTPKVFRKPLTSMLKLVYRKSEKIFVLGESIKKDLINSYNVDPNKIVIYKYKISEIFHTNVKSDVKQNLNPNGPIILTICRVSPEKGLNYLIEASTKIIQKNPNAKIIIKGSPIYSVTTSEKNYLEELRALIRKNNLEENISIIEMSPHGEIPKFLAAADVFVLPSLSEGFPLVILEALASGVPVVATPVGGIPDVLTSGSNALLVEPGNVDELAEAITRILSDDTLRQNLINNGLRTSHQIKENEIERLLNYYMFH